MVRLAFRKWLVGLALVLLAALGITMAGLGVMYATLFQPPSRMAVPVTCDRDAPVLHRGQRVRALVWNVQYAAGRDHHFFYDGGTSVAVDAATVGGNLDRIAEVIARFDPDLVILQEVDRRSRRTARIDEHAELLLRVPYACHASTPYHRVPYVPFPANEHLGRVDMHLSVFSRFRLDGAVRHQLPLMDETWVRRQFNLRRALLEVRVPLAGGDDDLVVFNSHLSSFTHGDGTLARQVAVVDERLAEVESAATPWFLGADLNTLPPGDDPTRLGAHAALYPDGSQVAPLIDRYHWPVPPAELASDPEPWRTYLPFGATRPDRTIDYVLHGSTVAPLGFSVVTDVTDVSDHLPLLFDFEVR